MCAEGYKGELCNECINSPEKGISYGKLNVNACIKCDPRDILGIKVLGYIIIFETYIIFIMM